MTNDIAFQDFIPDPALRSLTGAETATDLARCEGAEALILFVDMTGFSRMAAEFIAKSERGAEGLRDLVNTVFEAVVTAITDHGGSVLYYAGDAVNAVWPATEAEFATASARAIACGLDIQRRCKDLPDSVQGLVPGGIQMKASLHFGPLWTVNAPSEPDARQILFCGGVLEGLAEAPANDLAQGVVLDRALFERVKPHLGGVTSDTTPESVRITALDAPDLPAITPQTADVECGLYVHPHLRSAIQLGAQNWLAEFRTAHVLFLRIPGFGFSGADDLTHCANGLDALCTATSDQGGTLVQVCADDKGLVCIAAWGLAKSSYENDAARAVLAAQDAVQRLEALGLLAHAAVTSGKVFAGLLGARPLLQYSIVGDVLSRAASMAVQTIAPVTLDAATVQNLPSEFVCVEAAQLALKGHSAPVAIFVPTGQQTKNVLHHGEFVGRDAERAVLAERLAGDTVGDIQIIAEAGLGKSRLAAWFEAQMTDAGRTCLRMNADQLRQSSSYLPLRQIFDRLLDWPSDVSQLAVEARLKTLFADTPDSQLLLALLNPILPVDLPETVETKTLIGAGRAELARTMIVNLLQHLLGSDPALLLVEDAHWLDSASWLCLEAAKREMPDLSLLIVARPIDPDQIPTEVKKLIAVGSDGLHLQLGPLNRDDTAAITRQTLNATEVSDQIVDLVYREAAGHPLYTTALSASLVDRGLIRLEGGYAHLQLGSAPLSSVVFPQGVKGVISERISGLDVEHQLAIKTAAVLGRNFDLETLAAVFPMSDRARDLHTMLEHLTTAGLIEGLGDTAYRFHHAIIVDCAHEMLTTQQQQALHGAAGAKIEADVVAQNSEPAQTQLALMAYHFEHAQRADKAVPYLSQAARASRRSYGNVEVVDFLSRAIALSPQTETTPLERSEWQVQIAESLRALGQYKRAEEFLRAAIATLEKPAPQTGMQAAGQLLREFAKFKLRPHQPAQPDAQRKPIITAADANMMLSEIHYELNKIPFALSEILKGANLARLAGGDSATLSKLYIGMALISTSLPWALDGDDLQRRALDIADRLEDPATTSWVYMVSGVYETGKGGWQRGAEMLNTSREMSERCGERKTWETAMSCLGNHKRLEGYFNDAKGWSDLTMQASRERGIDHGVIWSHNGRARDLLCLSQFDALREDVAALERLLNDPTKTGDSNDNNNLVFHYAKAFCALKDGDEPLARTEFDTVIGMVERIKRPQVYMVQNVDYYCDILWALWHRGHRDAALMAQQKLVAKSGKQVAKQYRTGAPMALLAKGDGAWFQGDAKTAEKSWLASIEAAEARVMPYNAAHAAFRLEQTGLSTAGHKPALDWLREIGIERPLIWALDA